ncbi:type I secretion system permease/ATPase [Caulobacter sp. NIBR1757]|uniref:type I secretion system permease/ATPase n=1 Tax=Caulobacter sp. NIBR1757 TaxID=3016000 RepID=UPI0022F0C32A|nr:type I secretion system permease/ATPase [Caulobacter sp. NIBR1757]
MKFFGSNVAAPMEAAFKECRRHIMSAAFFSALVNLLYLAPSLYMLQVYDRVVPTQGVLTLVYLTFIIAFALAVLAALETVRSRLLVLAGMRLDRLLSGDILGRLMAQSRPMNTAQAMREFDSLRAALAGPAALAFMDAPWTPIYVIVAFMIHPALGTMTVIAGILLFGLALLNERATKPALMKAQQANAAAYASQEGAAQNGEVVRSLGMRRSIIARHLEERGIGQSLQAEAQFKGGQFGAFTKFFRLFLQSAALGLGAYLAIKGEISSGSIIAASILLSRALQPVEQLVGGWTQVIQARGALNTLSELFDKTKPLDIDRTQLPTPMGAVELDRVVVRAPGREELVLKAVSLKISPGESLGIVGSSGAGKTTLARVIAGALSPDQGIVRMDGANYTDWDADALAEHIGYLPQDPSLMSGTVKDNISRFAAWRGMPVEKIDQMAVEAATKAGVHDLILKLPKGYDTPLAPGGRGLSAGQAQRVALARALFGNPTLLILDEPNSALDAEGEASLLRSIQGAKARGATVLIVAHRTGILAGVDRLLVMRDGAIERLGPREEVLAKLAGKPAPKPQPNVIDMKGQA